MRDDHSRFLETADRIGSRLCRDALWAGGSCNWLGWSMDQSTWTPVYRALGPSPGNRLAGACLYEGTAGIALFLAQLFSVSRDRIHKCTLEGVLNQVLGQIRGEKGDRSILCEAPSGPFRQNGPVPFFASDDAPDIGFYTGLSGIAYTLIEAGMVLEHDRLVERGINELAGLRNIRPAPEIVDVMSGSAGVIPVLIDVASRFGRAELIETAAMHGEHLLSCADKSDCGWSWATNARSVRHLTGQSHGVAGIAWSLMELHAATGDERFRSAAREGLRYERHFFSAERRNWPDFRLFSEPSLGVPPSASGESAAAPQFSTAWCHGAPGIGISRLRVRELLPDDGHIAAELDAAIETTRASLREPHNFSLCHGHAGNAELLTLAAEQLSRPELLQAAETIGTLGIDRFSDTGIPWPCGVDAAWESPTLMLGLAGIGYFYLRLSDPKNVPSVLIRMPSRPGQISPGIGSPK